MKIIKPGDLSRLDTTRRFSCFACGCIWEADDSEYRKQWDKNDELIVCECPNCRRTTYAMPKGSGYNYREAQ